MLENVIDSTHQAYTVNINSSSGYITMRLSCLLPVAALSLADSCMYRVLYSASNNFQFYVWKKNSSKWVSTNTSH